MVLEAHAASDPRAVVIHLENAPITDAAVVSSWWLDNLALLAEPPEHNILNPVVVSKHTIVVVECLLYPILLSINRIL